MSDIALANPPTRQLLEAKDRSAPLKVTGKLRAAIDLMVWHGLTRKQAAQQAAISEHTLYVAFRKPHVKAHYLNELEVLRTSERARSIHRIAEIRDAADNMPALKAAEWFANDRPESQSRSTGSLSLPGLTIVIQNVAAPEAKVIDHE